jgi:hypothetical protein
MERGSNPSEGPGASEASHVHVVSYRSYGRILLGRLKDYESNV